MVSKQTQIKMPNMSRPCSYPPVTPLVAMLAGDPAFFDAARAPLTELLGPIDLESPQYPFDKTDYYTPSMGPGLIRKFLTFKRLANPGNLAAWKLAANDLELRLAPVLAPSGQPSRPINLDPGYMMASKLVLASTKNFAHRLYLRDGIFAEITMSIKKAQWVGHPFTFPDFKSGTYTAFFHKARNTHMRHTKHFERPDMQND